MNQTKRSDLNLSVVGTGFATSVGAICALFLIPSSVVVMLGIRAGQRSHFAGVLALVLGIAVHCIVGYVTGRTARAKRAPVNFHVFFVGVLVMLFALALLMAPGLGARGRHPGDLAMVIRVINILLTIPAMWLGAHWGDQRTPPVDAVESEAGEPAETKDETEAASDTTEDK